MSYLHLRGAGLPNVYLVGGYAVEEDEDGPAVSLVDVGGLYRSLSAAICMRTARLTGAEVRFLRKRLGWSQADVGNLSEKSAQAVAKWEKGQLPVPLGDSRLLRATWLADFDPRQLRNAVLSNSKPVAAAEPTLYVLRRDGEDWVSDDGLAEYIANEISRPILHEAMRAMDGASTTQATLHGVALQVVTEYEGART